MGDTMNAPKQTNGEMLAKLSDNAWTVSLARLMQLVGIPALMVISAWMFSTLNDVNIRVTRIEETIKQRIARGEELITQMHSDNAELKLQMREHELRLRALESAKK